MASVISVVPLFPIIGLVRSRASSGFRPFSGKAVCSEKSDQRQGYCHIRLPHQLVQVFIRDVHTDFSTVAPSGRFVNYTPEPGPIRWLSEQVACLEDILLKALEIEKAAETDL